MVKTRRAHLDRIASSTRNAKLAHDVLVGPDIVSREGHILAVRILGDKSRYNQVENVNGRLIGLRKGDVLAGTLGTRRALRGYAGEVPESLAPGDVINVLNLGGVLGTCTAVNPELGPPFEAEVLGAVLTFPRTGDRIGAPAHIGSGAIPPSGSFPAGVPVVFVAGTCMNSGKTVAATEIVRGLSRAGLRVAAVKATGVALQRDTLSMVDAGAVAGRSFVDAGIVSTHAGDVVPAARALLTDVVRHARPEVIVTELGDGILGEYGVQDLLAEPELMKLSAGMVVCAPDQVGAWGARRLLEEMFSLRPTVISGPATDNDVGKRFIREQLDLPAFNARRDADELIGLVLEAVTRARGQF